MKYLLLFLALLFNFTVSTYTQTKTFALGFEGTIFPDQYHQGDSLRDLNCNLWQGWDDLFRIELIVI